LENVDEQVLFPYCKHVHVDMPPLLYHISLAFLEKHLPVKEINKNLCVRGVFFTLQIMIGN